MNRRLEMLEALTTQGMADAFAWYGLALEYQREGRREEALGTFERLRDLHPDYLPMYLMAAQLLIDSDADAAARPWLEAGIALARERGESKALNELEAALEGLD
jgi:tetratricopeptide (TPR) repeat protein